MAALENTITAADIAAAQDIEMITRFTGDMDKLTEVLGLMPPEIVAAGTAMFQYTVTGTLNATTVTEGDEVPLSDYTVAKTQLDPITISPYRKLTTAQAILKGGYENAVAKTDNAMINQIKASILTNFFTFLGNGGSSVTATGLQSVLAQASAKIQDVTETNGDYPGVDVYFVNPYDIADYLAAANVTTQTVFGMTYIQSFLGVNNIMTTNKVAKGTVYATPVENIHIYGIDFATLGDAGLEYTTMEGSLIGVHHAPAYSRTSCETYALSGALFVPENTDYIVKGTISPSV